MTSLLRVRRGIPRFARKIASGRPARIVAFGTSLTLHSHCGRRLGGRYLDPLLPRMRGLTGNEGIELVTKGLEGFPSWWAAHRVRSDVLPLAPDLVLLEFAHNDMYVPVIPAAMHAIVAQLRAASPAVEIALVIMAPQGTAANGPSATMLAHEAVADYYGFPSFDLATLSEALAAQGRTLTFDGIHHNELASELLGVPFADAFEALVHASRTLPDTPNVAPPASPVARADRSSPRPFLDGRWTIGPPDPETLRQRTIAAFVDEIASANEPGAKLAFRFKGMHVQVWALSLGGTLRVVVDGIEQTQTVPLNAPPYWGLVSLATDMPDALHDVRIDALSTPLVFGDLFFVGELA